MGGNKRQQSESSSEEEEYEVERIVGHKIQLRGKKKTPSLKFYIKWKGYPDSDNTWESQESTDHCQDLVNEYWNRLKNGKHERARVERILKGEESESEDNEDFSDAKTTPPPKKRLTTVVTHKKRRAASPEETKKKVSAAAISVSKRRKTTKSTKAQDSDEEETETHIGEQEVEEEDDDEEEDFSETEIEHDDFRIKSNNWAKEVDKVVKVRNGTNEDNQQDLYGIVRWRDGKLGIYKTSFLTKKIPQLLIQYYERRLTFELKE